MFKKLLTSMMALAVFVLAGCGSASAEYTHVFHAEDVYHPEDSYDVYMDFAGIQVSKEERQGGTWTRYMVPAKLGSTYRKYFFARVDNDPNIWAMYAVDQGESTWYDKENWDNVKMDDLFAIENDPDPSVPNFYIGAVDLSNWNPHSMDNYFSRISIDVLQKAIQYKEGIITGKESVISKDVT